MQHLIDTNNFSDKQIAQLLYDTKEFKRQLPSPLLRDRLLITLFFEDSTRTRSSFEIAAKRLGANVVNLDTARSSTNKRESLEDTFANLCAMQPDGVIIRHQDNNAPKLLGDMNITRVINAGAGDYAHPTQALLDLFTIIEHFNIDPFGDDLKDKTIAIVGDIVSSRVASSGMRLFERMGMRVVLVAPTPFMPSNNLPQYESLDDVIDEVDIIMSLRAQLERHNQPYFDNFDDYAKQYCINHNRIGDRDILILHPGPVMRNIDISDDMLEDSRCKVLEQVKNGVYMRMAILKLLLLDS